MITGRLGLAPHDRPRPTLKQKGSPLKTISIIIAFFLIGCASAPVCRHKSLATVIMAAEQGQEVRIAAYRCGTKCRHAEAQIKIDGVWKYVKQDCEGTTSGTVPEHEPTGAIEYFGVHEYLLHIGVQGNF